MNLRGTAHIEITEEDIALGKPFQSQHCPIALAMTRCGFENVYVQSGEPYRRVTWGDGLEAATLPDAVCLWATAFDSGKQVQPFAFDLDGVP